ncbi:putative reverse transcriptase domain-containing protein [Tanacetum coccineum]|uniref:Reverse transcriptase domain-containing protein n=1 Tax=Tanacetum coccineum TaxID=301880 RepID=A0ABQ5BZP7_9ASTR
MHTVRGDGVASIKRCRRDLYGDGIRNLTTESGRGRLKEDLESSTWRRIGFKLRLVFALKVYRHCLYGTKSIIYTDHKSLQDIFNQKELNTRQRRWIELFTDYDCEIRYHPVAVQNEASEAVNAPVEMLRGLDDQIEHRNDGALYYLDRIWVPLTGDMRTLILDEAHKSKYSVYLGAYKMYYDLRDMYCWLGMKKDIALYVSKCLTCSKIKAERQRPSGLLQQPEILEWK